MARVELNLPENTHFTHRIDVRTTDLNAGGHVGNDQMISLVSESRYRFLLHLGIDELSLSPPNIIVTDLAIRYLSESFVQDTLLFNIGITDVNKYGADIFFHIQKADSNVAVAKAKQGFVFFDYQQRRVQPIPERFQHLFTSTTA